MAEEAEDRVPGAPGAGGADPAATAMALGGASRAEADIFLKKQGVLSDKQSALADKQSRFLDLQIDELSREDSVRHWSLRVRHISDVMKLAFEISLAFIVVAIAALIATAIWTASHNDGVVIEAFNVPPDLAAKGLTGEVIATQVQDRIAFMQNNADTMRAANSFRNDWGNDIKVQIPDTGVSIGEAYRFLSSWLGHETRITGEIWHDAGGIAISARAGNKPAKIFRGSDADLDKLIVAATEYVYSQTQPYRYIVFLDQQGRHAESLPAAQQLALNGPPEERPWAYSRWGLYYSAIGDIRGDLEKQLQAVKFAPNLAHVWGNVAADQLALGHDEAGLESNKRSLAIFQGAYSQQYASYAVAINRVVLSVMIAEQQGDFRQAAARAPQVQDIEDYDNAHGCFPFMMSDDLAQDHDVPASFAAEPATVNEQNFILSANDSLYEPWAVPPLPGAMRAVALDDWRGAHDYLVAMDNLPEAASPGFKPFLPVMTWPWLAYADARLGDFASARALIDRTPGDCYLCVRMRGNIDAAQGKWDAAAWWFDDATRQAPSIPFAYTDWGAMLLREGNYDGAIAKFQLANQKGPHFADPLEMWGEALIAKNRSDLALAKFEEADKYAPNWGRLHLKWGEALLWTGNKTDAQKQFAVARGLDLAAAEKSELMGLMHG
jgi:tetratricopeptide (TPR) repeat protein